MLNDWACRDNPELSKNSKTVKISRWEVFKEPNEEQSGTKQIAVLEKKQNLMKQ